MHGMKYIFVAIVLVGLTVWGVFKSGIADKNVDRGEVELGEVVKIEIGGIVVNAELAVSAEDRQKGLSGRLRLATGEGMLFIFPEPAIHSFWMKDMNFAIDIMWLDGNLRIVTIKERAEPSSYPESFAPSAPAMYVLEVPAGFTETHKIKIGDQAKILQ
jgi:uncharacterized membrane protein (UPF0127 family)